jgi:hypothetical protein
MKTKYRYFSEAEKRAAVKRIAAGEAASTVARDIGADRRRLYEWYHKHKEGGPEGLQRVGRPRKQEGQSARVRAWREASGESAALQRYIAELERKIGQQQVDLDFLSQSLAAYRGDTASAGRIWRRCVYQAIQAMTSSLSQGCSTSIERLCRVAGVSRAGYYRFWRKSAPRQHDMTVRDGLVSGGFVSPAPRSRRPSTTRSPRK